MREQFIIIDTVEDDEWEKKKYKKITSKEGDIFKVGIRLQHKWMHLLPDTPLKLTIDTYNNNEYVKDFDKCYDLAQDMTDKLSKPKKNIKDVSIEAQAAVKSISDMLICGQISVPDDIKNMTFEWIRKALKEATE